MVNSEPFGIANPNSDLGGKIVCSSCGEPKKKSEIEADGFEYICKDCMEED